MTQALYESILFYTAIGSTIFFALTVIMTFMGMDGTDGTTADFDGDTDTDTSGVFQMFTLRNLISFLMGLGWGSLLGLHELGFSTAGSTLIGTLIGFAMVAINTALIYVMSKLHSPNTIEINEAIGKTATVHLGIPAKGSGIGQATIVIGGALRHYMAITNDEDYIASNSTVEVTGIHNGNVLIVKSL